MDKFFEKFNDDNVQIHFGADTGKYSIFAVLGYLIPILFFLPFVNDKGSTFCKFHSNQSFCWFLVMLVAEVVCGILSSLGPICQILSILINLCAILGTLFFALGAYKGYALVVPVLGTRIEIFK